MSEQVQEHSFGVIPISLHNGKLEVFIIQNYEGCWLFPKGHAERQEKPIEIAMRELFEETGLSVDRWLSYEPYIERYYVAYEHGKIYKEVQYFVAMVSGNPCLQKEEVSSGEWVPLHEVSHRVTYQQTKELALLLQQQCQTLLR